jgi:glycine cleavage system aminomethyltransferase T
MRSGMRAVTILRLRRRARGVRAALDVLGESVPDTDMIPAHMMVPFEGDAATLGLWGPFAVQLEYTGWRDEVLAWKDGAYLGTALSMSPVYKISGPGAQRFLTENFVNGFRTLQVGGSRHGIMCDGEGRIMMDGTVLRTGEEEYITYWLHPFIQYVLESGGYDVAGEDLTGQAFLFQVAGPKSLEILEQASGQDLHDIEFRHHRPAAIAGHEVRIYRLGMAGGLAYEVHGPAQASHDVYRAIWGTGKTQGMKKLGLRSYMLNHTEDGFPQAYLHFLYPWYQDAKFAAWLENYPLAAWTHKSVRLKGSIGEDVTKRFVTPFDVGWENRINWNHDFTGKAALAKIAENPPRTVVTLEWNADDVADLYAAQLRDGAPYEPLPDGPSDSSFDAGVLDPVTGVPRPFTYRHDRVLKDGADVGVSSGRVISQTYRRMISLGFISRDVAEAGSELTVAWGSAGYPVKEIRVTVARFPYLTEERNDAVDVNRIPRLAKDGD